MLRKYLVAAVLLILAGYGAMEATPILSGPSLTIISPAPGQVASSSVVEIRGVAKRVVALTLDGAPVLPDEEGDFAITLAYPRGTSLLTFKATDRFGRAEVVTRTVVVP